MTIIYMAASIIGGVTTASLFGQRDLLMGILSGPLGGSLLAVAAALLLAVYARSRKPETVPPGVIWC
jgi:hypothetical protein